MIHLDWTSIVLALITLLGGCGWLFDRKRHRQEVESLKADIRQKDLDLSQKYVTDWQTYIAEPLQREVSKLRREVEELRNAIQRIDACAYRDGCPVVEQLQRKPKERQ